MISVGAVLLVGGRARRLGGIDKPMLALGGRTLLAAAVDALAAAGVAPTIAVGPVLDAAAPVVWVREDPPFGGPVAAVAAALPHMPAEWTLLLAGDLEHPDAVVTRLIAAIADGPDADAVVFTAEGRAQWLAGAYRTVALREVLAVVETPAGASVRSVLGGLAIAWIVDEDGVTRDIDAPADLDRARAHLEESS